MPTSHRSRDIVRWTPTLGILISRLPEFGKDILTATQGPGDNIFLPYGWLHCVSTLATEGQWTGLLSVNCAVEEALATRIRHNLYLYGKLEKRRDAVLAVSSAEEAVVCVLHLFVPPPSF